MNIYEWDDDFSAGFSIEGVAGDVQLYKKLTQGSGRPKRAFVWALGYNWHSTSCHH